MSPGLKDAFYAGVLTFISTLGINYATEYFMQDHGDVSATQVSINSQEYTEIQVDNFSSDKLNGLIFTTDIQLTDKKISSNKIIQISQERNDPSGKLILKISNIPSNSSTKIFIPGKVDFDLDSLQKAGLSISQVKPINRVKISIYIGLFTSLVYAIGIYILSRIEDGKKEILNIKIRKVEDELNRIRTDNKEAINGYRKHLILHSARVSEYRKELDFWRNTIRKISYDSHQKNNIDLVKLVEMNLKTYKLKNLSSSDFDNIIYAADLLNKQI